MRKALDVRTWLPTLRLECPWNRLRGLHSGIVVLAPPWALPGHAPALTRGVLVCGKGADAAAPIQERPQLFLRLASDTIVGIWRMPSGEYRLNSISMVYRVAHFLGKLGDDPACLNAMRIGGRIRTGLYPEAVDNGPTLT